MKKIFIFFALLFFVVFIIFVIYQIKTISGSQSIQNSTKISATTVTAYVDNCARCHGNGGEGFADKPAINNTSMDVEEIKVVILNGLEKMPSFQNIKDPSLSEIAVYVKKF